MSDYVLEITEPGYNHPDCYLHWHKWGEEKPRRKRWVLCWFAKDKWFEVWTDADYYVKLCDRPPTLWAYLPSQRDMVEK